MGAPLGNTNATKGKPWSDALARINVQSDGAKLRKIAEKVYEMAEAGDIQAIKEIADRHDGKAAQSIDMNHSGDGLAAMLTKLDATRKHDSPVA